MVKQLFVIVAVSSAVLANADVMDRPGGFKVGQRMTVRPYVSLYYTFDSNLDSSHHSDTRNGSSWNVNPGFTANYKSENWNIDAGAFYRYHTSSRNTSNLNESSYGQNLALTWSNTKDGGKGWSLNIREHYEFISQDDDMSNHEGRGFGRDRQQFQVGGTLQRRFTERWHASVDASYYFLDYDNDSNKYAPMYGWTRWTAGGQVGYVASPWTDLLLAANYQGYTQDNDRDRGGEAGQARGRKIGSSSKGWTLHAGIGTHATERISYRIMGGVSHFEYGDGAHDSDGFTYSVSSQWKMSDTWNMMLLATRYYQPSDLDYGSAIRADILSWGVAHSLVRGKVNATFNLNYRHEQHEYTEYSSSDYDSDIWTARLGLNYSINRFVSVFSSVEYQNYMSHDRSAYDYDRWRLSVGMRFTY